MVCQSTAKSGSCSSSNIPILVGRRDGTGWSGVRARSANGTTGRSAGTGGTSLRSAVHAYRDTSASAAPLFTRLDAPIWVLTKIGGWKIVVSALCR